MGFWELPSPQPVNSSDTLDTVPSPPGTTAAIEGETMVVVALPQQATEFDNLLASLRVSDSDIRNIARFAAAGSLLAGGVLLLSGQRRAGMITATAGTALALLDQQETLHTWWNRLPGYLDQVERVLEKVQATVKDVAENREKLGQILSK
jgi:hypothetical protein